VRLPVETLHPEELITAVREVQQGGAPMSREIARKVISYFQEATQPPGPAADPASEVENLSPREREILELLTQGFSDKEIADQLGVKHGTVRWHLQHVYEKLHVRSRTEAALKFHSTKAAYRSFISPAAAGAAGGIGGCWLKFLWCLELGAWCFRGH
jgi:DNA-binding NarL/FixJ family response regulator